MIMKVIVTFPKSQSLGNKKGFFENVELINSDKGIELYGGGAYLVNKEWYENVKKGNVEDVEYTDEEYENRPRAGERSMHLCRTTVSLCHWARSSGNLIWKFYARALIMKKFLCVRWT